MTGESHCVAFERRRTCRASAQGNRWADETCAAGSGCLRGQCVVGQCSDECTLGQTYGTQSCQLFDVTSSQWTATAPASSLHDRAREYLRWLNKDALPFGGVGEAVYSDPPAFTTVSSIDGLGDSALWTGTYLASEALRLLSTGAPDARDHVVALVDTLHLWFNVSPSPGVLARFVRPAGVLQPDVGINCASATHHCDVLYEGRRWDYNCHVSRDQYQGVLLGYALAYEALGSADERSRALIRDDVFELVEELMKERQVKLKLTYNGTTYPAFTGTTRYFVIVNEELDQDGAIELSFGSSGTGGWRGFQEFAPDLGPLFKQVPLLGLILPSSIPRDGSAIMLASFFRVALKVSENVPALATRRAAIEQFYDANVASWVPIARQWTVGGTNCGNQYYSNNISMQPMYNWARLETSPGLRDQVEEIVATRMWTGLMSHKNTFFTFISAANMKSPDAAVVAAARAQLAQFPAPPNVRKPVDLRSDARFMPHQPGCTDKANLLTAVDVGERVMDGFIWQRDPWSLYDPGDPGRTAPGVDYMVAYWLGRRHAFIDEDAAGRCLRKR